MSKRPDFKKIAHKYRENGISVIPVNSTKQSTVKWTEFKDKLISAEQIDRFVKDDTYGLALICGGVNSIECLDIDLKYSLTGTLYDDLKKKIPVDILKKMWVQSTPSGGYHWIYKCETIEGNLKLSNRLTTTYEKHETYMENFANPKTRDKALSIASKDVIRVLVETRGIGGYFVVAPTPGYERVYGKLQEITTEERDIILEAGRSFNEYVEEVRNFEVTKFQNFEVSPFEDYNVNGDALALLLSSGWQIVSESHTNVRLRRAGSPRSQSSGLYDKHTGILNVFSTSTAFDVGKGYNPTNIFITLEANGDTKLAYKKLIELGYGKEK